MHSYDYWLIIAFFAVVLVRHRSWGGSTTR